MEAVVLAGGLGTRLRSVVNDIPKCMAPVSRHPRACPGEKPFLSYILEWLSSYEITRVVLSVGYLKECIMDWASTQDFPFQIDYAVENEPLGTGGGIKLALSKCRERKVIVVNGDTFFPVDLDAIPFDAPVTVALKPMKDFDRYGAVELSAGQVLAFHEKAPCKEGLINGGVYAVNGLDLSYLPEKFSFEKDVLEPLAAKGMVGGWVSDTYFIDIGIPDDYSRAQTELPVYMAVKEASARVMASDADTLLLDRDGTINEHILGDYVRTTEQFKFLPGVLEEFPRWAARFRRIIIVTNQRGVGRGLMTDADLASIHQYLLKSVQDAGGRIDAILVCTAVSDDDPRRKPNTGMYREARQLFPDIRKSVMLGDGDCDREFAQNAGIEFVSL
jgi:D-glycero-alpha-D-manno-heptose 1-phosphate guanylyltransferase